MYTIRIRFEQKELQAVELENVEPGQSLLEICLNQGISLNHRCGGVCSCTTCHLYIQKGNEYLEEMSKREMDFISRLKKPKDRLRLGCQSIILDGKGEIEVVLPDQRYNL